MSDTLTLPDTDSGDREPIHTPGAIQPHGMVLVVEAGSLRVRHVAGEIERRLDIAEWEDQPMAALIDPRLSSLVSALLVSEAAYGFIGQLEAAGGEMLDVTACVSMPYVIIELET